MRCDPKFNKKLNQSKKVLGKLYLVTSICFGFMIFEFIGGWLSNSVAIMTDAAHMLSDVAGFFISIMSIHLAMKAPTEQKSYGFLRTEVLGALMSIVFIWVLVIWLVVEATFRVHDILHHEGFEIQAGTMILTAIVSLICNIVNLIALGHCSWSGIGGDNMLDSVNSVFKPHGGHCCGHDHGSGDHGHEHSHGDSHGHSHGHSHHGHGPGSSCSLDHDTSHKHKNKHNHHSHVDSHSETTSCSSHGHSHDHGHGHSHGHSHAEEEATCYDSSESNHFDNLNLKAAVVHLIGDLLQSVGVLIAAIVIKIWPEWKIIDPICTYLFSIIVMFTTYNVFIECYQMLMEGTPSDIRVDYIREDILRIKGVEAIDDFHCWSISGGKNLLTAHIRLLDNDEEAEETNGTHHKSQVRRVHKEAMQVINQHDICHVTL